MSVNLCTNPSFEYGTTGWGTTSPAFLNAGAAIAQVANDNAPSAGTHALQVTTTAAVGQEGTVITIAGPNGGNWISGTTYNFTIYIRSISGSTALFWTIGASGADTAQTAITITSAWVQYSVNWTPNTNEATTQMVVRTQGPAAAVFNIDAALAIQGSVPITYFDGDTAGFQWTGTPGNSTSQTIPPYTRGYYDRPRLNVLIDQKDLTERCDSIVFSATATGGFEIATLGLPSVDRPLKGKAVTIRQGLEVAWAGRVAEIADHSQHGHAIKTTGCEGYRALLRDTLYSMVYVDRDLSRWGPPSVARQIAMNVANGQLATSQAATDPTSGTPALMQSFQGAWVSPAVPQAEAWYDAGPGNLIAQIYYLVAKNSQAGDGGTWNKILALSSDANEGTLEQTANLSSGAAAYFAPATPYRFAVAWHANTATPSGTQGVTYQAFWKNLALYGNHGLTLRGSDPGGFYPSDIARHALSQCSGVLPGVIIDATGYIAPHVVYRTPTAADVIVDDMAKLMGWSWGVWEPPTILSSQPRLDFRPPPSDATCVVSKAECDQLDVTSRLGDLYDTCTVLYTDAAGSQGSVTVTLANPQLYEAGIAHRTLSLNMGLASSAAATSFANFALALSQVAARAAGSATLPVSVRLIGGGSKPSCLLRPGIDRLRITDLVDGGPLLDIGQVRRDVFRISRVETTVAKDGSFATVAELDSGTNLLEVLQARLTLAAAVVGQGASGG